MQACAGRVESQPETDADYSRIWAVVLKKHVQIEVWSSRRDRLGKKFFLPNWGRKAMFVQLFRNMRRKQEKRRAFTTGSIVFRREK